MNMDRLVPSYRNAITVAVLEFRLKLTLGGLVGLDYNGFLAYTRFVIVFLTGFIDDIF